MTTFKRLSNSSTPSNRIGIFFDRRHSSLVAQAKKLHLNYPNGTKYRFLQLQVKSYRASGIEKLLAKQQNFAEEKKTVNDFAENLLNKQQSFGALIESLADCEFNPDLIAPTHKEEIKALTDRANADLELVRREIRSAQEMAHHIANQFKAQVKKSSWQKSSKVNEEQVVDKKKELAEKGVEDIDSFEQLIEQLN
ncbi:MAG: hypothetical protein D3924_14365 [Candidatus Electrothrix sp. AR4]|nr:hypothetical protein [Candidatus Electrothrix sp. AR4]